MTLKVKTPTKPDLLIQLRLKSKTLEPLSPYTAYEELAKALANHPTISISQAEFRVEKDEEKTSI